MNPQAVNRGRLQNITHAFASGGGWSTQVQHDYAYDVSGRITSWRWRSPAIGAQASIDRRWEARHDAADQLESVTSYSGETSTVLEQWGYAYDPAGNRSYEEHAGTGIISKSGTANRLQQRGGAGNLRVSGSVDKAASVTVNGQPARVTSTAGAAPFRFEKDLAVGTGTQTFSIAATDGSTPPQTTTKSYQINVPSASQIYEHDRNGNLITVRNGSAVVRGYEWDAANRLIKIIYADGGSTAFQYDGMSQRRVITEKAADGSVTGTTKLLWKDGRVWQEQDGSGRVTKRYHFNGVQTLTYTGASTTPASTSNTLTLTDHLGSHREMMTFSGGASAITGRRDFDPYGKATQTGTVPSNAAYTSHYLHERSGLELALYRAYDSELGRWLNEDPLGEEGGLALYRFSRNRPMDSIDLLGLEDWYLGASGSAVIVAGMNAGIGGVIDTDTWLDSGIYVSLGVGLGVDLGCGVNAGRMIEGDIEGSGGSFNYGALFFGGSILTSTQNFGDYIKAVVDQGWNIKPRSIPGNGLGYGAPKATIRGFKCTSSPITASINDSYTWTLSPNSIAKAVKFAWNAVFK